MLTLSALIPAYDQAFYHNVCTTHARVVGLEQATRYAQIYKLDNGQRWEDSALHQDGDTVCIKTEHLRK